MNTLHSKTFPGESPEYRDVRNKLIEAEIELRRKTEEVAELRRKLPVGGKVKEDYEFQEMDDYGNIKQTKLSELFMPGKDTMIIYNAMYGPEDREPCPSCTQFMDGMNGMIFHAEQRVNFAMVSKAPIERIEKWASSRGWKNLHVLSSNKNMYNKDYFGENDKGEQMPSLNVFRKTPNGVFHFYNTELLFVKPDEGQDPRHSDVIDPLWNLFDYTPEGRGTDWYPKLSYD